MKAAIVQPGVPTARLPDRAGLGLVIALDGAAADHAADWWVVSTPHAYHDTAAVGAPRILASRDTAGRLFPFVAPDRVEPVESLWDRYPAALGWSLYPSTRAVVLAASLGATEIELFAGAAAAGRPAECLQCEGEIMAGLIAHLRDVAIKLTWPAPDPNPDPTPDQSAA